MNRIVGIILAVIAGAVLLYLSRFWIFDLWSQDGLFGIKDLRPAGGLLARWLRGTGLGPYELMIWAVLVFMGLTYLQKAYDRLTNK